MFTFGSGDSLPTGAANASRQGSFSFTMTSTHPWPTVESAAAAAAEAAVAMATQFASSMSGGSGAPKQQFFHGPGVFVSSCGIPASGLMPMPVFMPPFPTTTPAAASLAPTPAIDSVSVFPTPGLGEQADEPVCGDDCVVCADHAACVALIPCGHMCCCTVCAARLVGQACPICRENVHSAMRIYS
jgi:hypothetical protein